jgi:hypothetical protein
MAMKTVSNKSDRKQLAPCSCKTHFPYVLGFRDTVEPLITDTLINEHLQ